MEKSQIMLIESDEKHVTKSTCHPPLYQVRCQEMAKRTCRNNGEKGVGKDENGVRKENRGLIIVRKLVFKRPLPRLVF